MRYFLRFLFFFLVLCSNILAQSPDKDIHSLLQALSVEKKAIKRVELFNKLAGAYHQQDKLDIALDYSNQAIELAKKNKDYIGLGDAHNLRARIYGGYSNYPKMLEDFLESEQYYRKTNNKKALGRVLSDIGSVYYSTYKFEKALDFLKKASDVAYELNDSTGIANNLLNRGLCYNVLGKTSEALEVLLESERIFKLLNNPSLLTNVYLGMSQSYQKLKDFEKSEYYIQLSIKVSEKSGDKLNLVFSRAALIELYVLSKSFDKGKVVLEKLLSEIETIDAIEIKKGIYETLIYYAEASNDYEAAYQYMKVNQKLTDSLYVQEREKEQKRLETVLELKQKETEAQQKDTVIQQQRTTMLGAFCALLFIGLLLYLQFRNNAKLRKAKTLLEEHQAEISERKKELEQLNGTKDRLFSIISHDLMSPIATLSSLLELLKAGAISPEAMPMFLDEALMEVGNTSVFLRNLLLWTKNQMDGFVVKLKVLAPKEFIENGIDLVQPQIRKKKLQINCDFRTDLKAFVDEDLIQTVFRNLLANAIKFSFQNGVIQIVVEENKNGMLQITLKDEGVGIPKDAQDKILSDEMYSTYGTQNEKGTGIGLSLCKEFVAKNGGKIWFESEVGKGTSFYFTLPVAQSNPY